MLYEVITKVGLTGVMLTKMDGDARGGAALSTRAVTGAPIMFVGAGEKPDALESFFPDRMASRILGMGDILTLAEKAQETIDEKKAKQLERKIRRSEFTLEDFRVITSYSIHYTKLYEAQTRTRVSPTAAVLMVPRGAVRSPTATAE